MWINGRVRTGLSEVLSVNNSTIETDLRLVNTGTGLGTGSRIAFSTTLDYDNAFIQSSYYDANAHNLEFGVGGSATQNGAIALTISGNKAATFASTVSATTGYLNSAAPFLSLKTTQAGATEYRLWNSYTSNGDLVLRNETTSIPLLRFPDNSSSAYFYGTVISPQLQSTVATGTAPLTVASTTLVSNLNADLLDGQHGSYYQPALTGGLSNYVAKWTGTGTLGYGVIYDNGTNVGIGTTSPQALLDVFKINDVNLRVTTGYSANGQIGSIISFYDGYNVNENARIATSAEAAYGGSLLLFTKTGDGLQGIATEKVRILGNGNVGIGTTSPQAKLSINVPWSAGNDGQEGALVTGQTGTTTITGIYNIQEQEGQGFSAMSFKVYNGVNALQERMRIASGGNVGIGTTSPDSKLRILTGGGTPTNQFRINYNNTNDNYQDASNHYFRSGDGTQPRFSILSTGNVLINTTTDNGVDKLQVNGSSTATASKATDFFYLSDAGNAVGGLFKHKTLLGSGVDNTAHLFSYSSTLRLSATNPNAYVEINSSGRLLVGATDNGVDKLQVNGSISATAIKLTTGATSGYVLTSDVNGNGTWQEPANTGENNSVQTLSGTTPAWNVLNGNNAKITLTGATTITLSNLVAGSHGTLTVTNGGNTSFRITFSGYTIKIHDAIRYTTNQVAVSGGTTFDEFTWYYNGDFVSIRGGLNLW
jgi:hypothetical protein